MNEIGALVYFVGLSKPVELGEDGARVLREIMMDENFNVDKAVVNGGNATIVCRNIAFVEWNI